MIGYTKFDALNDYAMLEAAAREDLNKRAIRVSAVLNPVKLIVTNYPEIKTEEMLTPSLHTVQCATSHRKACALAKNPRFEASGAWRRLVS